MRFIHISDLHIGRKLQEFSLEDDQHHILEQILWIIDSEHPDGVLIAGDIYDSSNPLAGAVAMFDWFLTELSKRDTDVFIISGNHDSPERVGYGSGLFQKNRIFVSGVFSGKMDVRTVKKGNDSVDVCLLPFVRPADVRQFYPDEKIESYTDAVRTAIAHSDLRPGKKIAVTHQFVVPGDGSIDIGSGSEMSYVGGTEAVNVGLFDGFDYVALGHIHKPQTIAGNARYCGSPLKYSSSEAMMEKSVTIVDVNDEVCIRTVPLKPLRDVRVVKGPLADIVANGRGDDSPDDFIFAELTDIQPLEAMSALRSVYKNTVSLTVGRAPDAAVSVIPGMSGTWEHDPVKVFAELYKRQTGQEMNEQQQKLIKEVAEKTEVRI
jgi:exonuclease SbcD